ncbi:MAG: trypsin-like serine protease [Bdellovibrio sp.]|nr:trypsin-like serine protease [Bdellovibrio sp.]
MNTRTLINTLLALSFVAFFVSCTPSKPTGNVSLHSQQSNIINGVDSTSDFQKQNGVVGIYIMIEDAKGNQGGAICTGSLIRKNVVLTAAHCLTSTPDMQIVGGIVFFTTGIEEAMKQMDKGDHSNLRKFAKITHHELYTDAEVVGSTHDVGLIRLNEDAPAGFEMATILPAALKDSLIAGASLTLSGYGVSSYIKSSNSEEFVGGGDGVLRQVAGIKVTEIDSTGEEIVLDQTSGGACHGDSGGPAYLTVAATQTAAAKTYLVGVTSRGEEPCNKDSVYSSTLGYKAWIDANLVKILQ